MWAVAQTKPRQENKAKINLNNQGYTCYLPIIERKKFIMPCPADDCRGFLSTSYKCEVCKKFSCPKCLVVLGEKSTFAA